MRSTLLAVLALACVPGSPDDIDPPDATEDPTTTDDTPTTVGEPTGTASCTNTAHPLIVSCDAQLGSRGPATLTLSADGAPVRTFRSEDVQLEHQLLGWGLKADTTYGWTFAGESGSITTGSLPKELASAAIEVTGNLFGIDAVMVYVSCGWFVMVDTDGDIVWGAPTTVYDGLSDGMMWSAPDRTVLAARDSTMSFGESLFSELDLFGQEVLRLEPDTHFSMRLTHDVGRWKQYTYLLGEQNGIGGFEVWDGTTHLGSWLLTDDFDGVGGLGGAHVNGLSVSEDGEVVISVFGFNGVVTVDGDPSSPSFLDLLWHASGSPGGNDDLPDPDFVPAAGELFERQHNASVVDGDLWVFDNRSRQTARALRMRMDPANGQIVEEDAWSLGQQCANQGGAMAIDGGVLATCANSRDVYAFRDGADTAEWTMHSTCSGGGGGLGFGGSTRAFPVVIE